MECESGFLACPLIISAQSLGCQVDQGRHHLPGTYYPNQRW